MIDFKYIYGLKDYNGFYDAEYEKLDEKSEQDLREIFA
jgi:hypothetical protein